ncbi:MAG TPA: ABC transporter permease [Gemmatimonadaceae bacterium]|nr:ABC transporter permease [Gemmatimonadaceae bacterium]
MMIGEILRVALGALRANKLRSLLTMLGIVIGVAAVIAMVALGRGAQLAVKDRISALGTTMLTVVPGQVFQGGIASSTDRARLQVSDADALETKGPPPPNAFAGVEPEMTRQLQVQWRNTNTSTNVIGTTPNYLDVRKYTIGTGRMFDRSDDDGRKRVAVLGATTADNLDPGNGNSLVGQSIRISGIEFQVIGITAPKGGASGFNDPDDQVLIPLNTARFRVMDTQYLRSINVLAASESQITETMADIQRILRREHRLPAGRPDDFEIRNQSDFLNAFQDTTQVFGLLLAGIATVSLLVGGIGIMNIMLVSVSERTREIGLRMAVGAKPRQIWAQFLVEAFSLSMLGGALGIALGVAGARALAFQFGWPVLIEPDIVLIAASFSALVGIAFGLYPAQRAARLDPIEALRYE